MRALPAPPPEYYQRPPGGGNSDPYASGRYYSRSNDPYAHVAPTEGNATAPSGNRDAGGEGGAHAYYRDSRGVPEDYYRPAPGGPGYDPRGPPPSMDRDRRNPYTPSSDPYYRSVGPPSGCHPQGADSGNAPPGGSGAYAAAGSHGNGDPYGRRYHPY